MDGHHLELACLNLAKMDTLKLNNGSCIALEAYPEAALDATISATGKTGIPSFLDDECFFVIWFDLGRLWDTSD